MTTIHLYPITVTKLRSNTPLDQALLEHSRQMWKDDLSIHPNLKWGQTLEYDQTIAKLQQSKLFCVERVSNFRQWVEQFETCEADHDVGCQDMRCHVCYPQCLYCLNPSYKCFCDDLDEDD